MFDINNFLLMTGFEPQTSGIGSDCSTNWATTTSLTYLSLRQSKFVSLGHCPMIQSNVVRILVVWPDLAKFRHFGTTLKYFGRFESVHLVFAKSLSLFRPICNAIGQILIAVNSQILNKNLVIWSPHRWDFTSVWLVQWWPIDVMSHLHWLPKWHAHPQTFVYFC